MSPSNGPLTHERDYYCYVGTHFSTISRLWIEFCTGKLGFQSPIGLFYCLQAQRTSSRTRHGDFLPAFRGSHPLGKSQFGDDYSNCLNRNNPISDNYSSHNEIP